MLVFGVIYTIRNRYAYKLSSCTLCIYVYFYIIFRYDMSRSNIIERTIEGLMDNRTPLTRVQKEVTSYS